jgi:hypothetical protein
MAYLADDMTNVDDNVDRTATALKFFSIHATKSTKILMDAIAQWPDVDTPNGINIGPKIKAFVESPIFVTAADGGSESDKYLSNAACTTKRLNRLPYMFANHKCVWGLMQRDAANLAIELGALYKLEVESNFRDMNSLSCLWYMCIGRHNMINPITDHNDKSGENILATLLGKNVRSPYGMSRNAYSWGGFNAPPAHLRGDPNISDETNLRRRNAGCTYTM